MPRYSPNKSRQSNRKFVVVLLCIAGTMVALSMGTPDGGCGGTIPDGFQSSPSALTADGGTVTIADRDQDGVPDDKDKCDTPAEYIPGYGYRKPAVGPDGCKRLVMPKICNGDTTAPSMLIQANGTYRPWAVWGRPVQMAKGASLQWMLDLSMYEHVVDSCPLLVSALSGSVSWPKGAGRMATRFLCSAGFQPATADLGIPPGTPPVQDLVIGSPGTSLGLSGVMTHAPCLVAIPAAEQASFQQALAAKQVTLQARIDVYDANQNHLAMGYGPSNFGSAAFSLDKPAFNQAAQFGLWNPQPAAVACAGARFPANLAVQTSIPQVNSAATIDNATLTVTVPGAKMRANGGAGAICPAQPGRVAFLASATLLRAGGAREELVNSANPLPCAIDGATGNVTCSILREHLAAEPGMTLSAKVGILGDLGTQLTAIEISTP